MQEATETDCRHVLRLYTSLPCCLGACSAHPQLDDNQSLSNSFNISFNLSNLPVTTQNRFSF
jgi:hypothetical protein